MGGGFHQGFHENQGATASQQPLARGTLAAMMQAREDNTTAVRSTPLHGSFPAGSMLHCLDGVPGSRAAPPRAVFSYESSDDSASAASEAVSDGQPAKPCRARDTGGRSWVYELDESEHDSADDTCAKRSAPPPPTRPATVLSATSTSVPLPSPVLPLALLLSPLSSPLPSDVNVLSAMLAAVLKAMTTAATAVSAGVLVSRSLAPA